MALRVCVNDTASVLFCQFCAEVAPNRVEHGYESEDSPKPTSTSIRGKSKPKIDNLLIFNNF